MSDERRCTCGNILQKGYPILHWQGCPALERITTAVAPAEPELAGEPHKRIHEYGAYRCGEFTEEQLDVINRAIVDITGCSLRTLTAIDAALLRAARITTAPAEPESGGARQSLSEETVQRMARAVCAVEYHPGMSDEDIERAVAAAIRDAAKEER